MTIGFALQLAHTKLAGVSDAPRLDIERLLLSVLKQPESSWLYAHSDQPLDSQEQQEFASLVERRATGEPLAYILGQQEFYGRPFLVTPAVLIPRPETEQLVEKALRYIKKFDRSQLTIADIGTGSGIIAITLALELTKFEILDSKFSFFATDISPAALAVARRNAEQYRVADQIEFLEGDMLAPFDFAQGKPPIDLIVSNPPYVPSADIANAGSARDTRGLTWEPRTALDGGSDGQRFVNQIKTAGIPAVVEGTNGKILSFLDS